MATIKVYACYTVTNYKYNQKTAGRAPGAPVVDPPLTLVYITVLTYTYFYK